jgi:hypothetical protein
MGGKMTNRRAHKKTRPPEKPLRRTIGGVLWGILCVVVLWIGNELLLPTIKDVLGSAVKSFEREQLELRLSIQPYDIQSGLIDSSTSLGPPIQGDLDDLKQALNSTMIEQIAGAVKRDRSVNVALELSGFTLRSSRPLELAVSELHPTQSAIQLQPGTRLLTEQGADLRNFFKTGKFFDRSCGCIHIVLQDDAGRFTGGPDRIYLIKEQPSFSAQMIDTRVDAILQRGKSTVALIIETPGVGTAFSEQVKATIRQMLKDGLEKGEFIRISSLQTREQLKELQSNFKELPQGPEKSQRIMESNIDKVLIGIVHVRKWRPFSGSPAVLVR